MLYLLLSLALAAPVLPAATHKVGRSADLDLPMTDGVALRTHVRLPDGPGPFPAVLSRVPYESVAILLENQCGILVKRGLACVWQEVRGRGRSEGEWAPFIHEERDGHDTIAWIRDQDWSDGDVVLMGESYYAATAWIAAGSGPPGVKGVVGRIFGPEPYMSLYEHGLARHEIVTAWMTLMPGRATRFAGAGGRYHRALRGRPRATIDLVAGGQEVGWYRQWLASESPDDPYWAQPDSQRFAAAAEAIPVPVMIVAGWSDAFLGPALRSWERLKTQGESLLVIGPWAHLGQHAGDIPLPHADDGGGLFQWPRSIAWIQATLSGTPPGGDLVGAWSYVVGGARWEHHKTWPPATEPLTYTLVAGSDRCDGRLSSGPPVEGQASWTYDPEHPLPSMGGSGILAGAIPTFGGVPPGFQTVTDLCDRREDVVRFEGPDLDGPLHLTGPFQLDLEVQTDVPDTAFGFRVLWRRGRREIMLREGFTTLSLREGKRDPVAPGTRVPLHLDTWPLDVELSPGDSLVVVLTSSSFPTVEAHPNQAGPASEATTTQVAHQIAWLGAAKLTLPLRTPGVSP